MNACIECGRTDPPNKLLYVEDASWCRDCYNLYFFKCSLCNKHAHIHKSDSVLTDLSQRTRKKVCSTCYQAKCIQCNGRSCRHVVLKSISGVGEDGFIYCNSCLTSTFHCRECNHEVPTSNAWSVRYCLTCRRAEERYIPGHNFKVDTTCQGKGPHFFGVELEVEVSRTKGKKVKLAQKVGELFNGFAITKHDGSLKYGFEIVTVPASMELQKKQWNEFFNHVPDGLLSFNTKTCGLHVHCSKTPLSFLAIGKIVMFVNEGNNHAFVNCIADRKFNSYCQWKQKRYGDMYLPERYKSREERYEAVNLINKDTIEFRIFRGTLKREKFFKCLEFCDALIHFCLLAENGISQCRKVDNFISYVRINRKEYPHLDAFINARWLKKETKETKRFGFEIKEKSPREQHEHVGLPGHEPVMEPFPPFPGEEVDDLTEGTEGIWGPDEIHWVPPVINIPPLAAITPEREIPNMDRTRPIIFNGRTVQWEGL